MRPLWLRPAPPSADSCPRVRVVASAMALSPGWRHLGCGSRPTPSVSGMRRPRWGAHVQLSQVTLAKPGPGAGEDVPHAHRPFVAPWDFARLLEHHTSPSLSFRPLGSAHYVPVREAPAVTSSS